MVPEALLSATMIACLQTETPAMAVVAGEKDVRAKKNPDQNRYLCIRHQI